MSKLINKNNEIRLYNLGLVVAIIVIILTIWLTSITSPSNNNSSSGSSSNSSSNQTLIEPTTSTGLNYQECMAECERRYNACQSGDCYGSYSKYCVPACEELLP